METLQIVIIILALILIFINTIIIANYSKQIDRFTKEINKHTEFINQTKKIDKSLVGIIVEKALKDLEIYGGCSVCENNIGTNAITDCKYGGCNGGGDGKHKENLWKYKYFGKIRI
jgi:hypothetical protein